MGDEVTARGDAEQPKDTRQDTCTGTANAGSDGDASDVSAAQQPDTGRVHTAPGCRDQQRSPADDLAGTFRDRSGVRGAPRSAKLLCLLLGTTQASETKQISAPGTPSSKTFPRQDTRGKTITWFRSESTETAQSKTINQTNPTRNLNIKPSTIS